MSDPLFGEALGSFFWVICVLYSPPGLRSKRIQSLCRVGGLFWHSPGFALISGCASAGCLSPTCPQPALASGSALRSVPLAPWPRIQAISPHLPVSFPERRPLVFPLPDGYNCYHIECQQCARSCARLFAPGTSFTLHGSWMRQEC